MLCRMLRNVQTWFSLSVLICRVRSWCNENVYKHLTIFYYFVVIYFYIQSLTFLRDVSPLRIGELILAQPDPLLHAWRDGLTCVWVERRKPAQTINRREETKRLFYFAVFFPQNINIQYSRIAINISLGWIKCRHTWYSQDIHDYTQRPHVTWFVIFLWPKHFWGWNEQIDTEKTNTNDVNNDRHTSR